MCSAFYFNLAKDQAKRSFADSMSHSNALEVYDQNITLKFN